jgi:hypothetical protein
VFAGVWTFHGCRDNKSDYKQFAYQNSTLHSADLSIWHREKNLTDATYIPYLMEIGFYDSTRGALYPKKLANFSAKQIDVLIHKTPIGLSSPAILRMTSAIKGNLLIAGAMLRDSIDRTAFITKYVLNQDYNVMAGQLDLFDQLLPSEFGLYPMMYTYELIDEITLLYYFQHIGYSCGRHCRRTAVYPEKITHYPDELLEALIKKYEEKYNWAELTFTSSGAFRNGFADAIEMKKE